MTVFLSRFTAAELTRLGTRATYTEKQAESTTGTLVAGDDPGEIYLDDPNALFVSNGVVAGDIIQITAGPISPLGEYTIASYYYDPAVQAVDHEPFETRITLDGFPTLGGPITYTVLSSNVILEELAQLTINTSRIENVIKPPLIELDSIFTEMERQYNTVCDMTADVSRWLVGLDRERVTPADITAAANATGPSLLFPLGYFLLRPDDSAIHPLDNAAASSEQAGKNLEVIALPLAIPLPAPPQINAPYQAALDLQDGALSNQDSILSSLEAEILNNDTTAEAGDVSARYLAIQAEVAAQRASIVLRRADIATMESEDKRRGSTAAVLNFPTFPLLQAEIDLRKANLAAAAFTLFLTRRYTYLDSLVNRAFGTRTDLVSLDNQLTFSADRRATLIDELDGDRELLEL